MKTSKSIFLIFMLLIFFSGHKSSAQSDRRLQKLFDEARQYHGQQNYELAIKSSRNILARDSSYVDAHLLLADIFHETGNRALEIFHLEKAAVHSDMPLISFRLGNAYHLTGAYQNALDAFQSYIKGNQVNASLQNEVERKIASCRFALNAIKNKIEFNPERMPDGINSNMDEYWPSLSIDQKQLVITRLITAEGQQPQEDFYLSEYDDTTGWGSARPVPEINTPENEGAQALSADGNILFFTACNRRDGFGSCDIYYSVRRKGGWSVPVNAGAVLNSAYWEAQPSFSSDGRFLYFSGNRPGGKGLRDIWRAECLGFDKSGRLLWKNPENLGDSINTAGNESSPFIHAGNMDFYFASDYHTGMGGFDLFLSRLLNDSIFSRPRNLGYPINTYSDEQGIYISADGHTAYFSSARDSVTGRDIYFFEVDESIRPHPATYVKAVVSDSETYMPVQATIDLLDLAMSGELPRQEVTDGQGEILICLPAGKNYSFSVSKEGYLFYSDVFDLRDIRQFYDPYELHIGLNPIRIGAEMNLYNVYFETDSFRILPESEPELQKLIDFMKNNPGLSVEVQGHTDNTGIDEKNNVLSDKRARSVVDFLVLKGIQQERLRWAGYGEAFPVAGNDTPEGRFQNRRTTIKILGE